MVYAIRGLFSKVGRLFTRSEFDGVDPRDADAIARDLGVTSDDLSRLERQSISEQLLLPQRMSQEGIDVAVVQAEWPPVWRDLQRVCAFCESKHICEYDLQHAPDAPGWHRYCGNDGTFKALHTKAA